MKLLCLLPLFAACTASSDVTAPFTGALHRFAIDRLDLPTNSTEARAAGDDLDGDGTTDNLLGQDLAFLAGQGDTPASAADVIASGVVASSLEILADDLVEDPHVGVTYRGADGAAGEPAGGTFVDGVFVSNRTRSTQAPGLAHVLLPAFVDVDPIDIQVDHVEIDLTSDDLGGYIGFIRGCIPGPATTAAATTGLAEMIAADPQDHLALQQQVDPSAASVSPAQLAGTEYVAALLVPDVVLGGEPCVSLGLGFHASPCDSGACATGPIADPCADRLRDGDETDVDCGGSCGACGASATCAVDADCQSHACLLGRCAAPACSDGVRDGFETGVDCGGPCAACTSA